MIYSAGLLLLTLLVTTVRGSAKISKTKAESLKARTAISKYREGVKKSGYFTVRLTVNVSPPTPYGQLLVKYFFCVLFILDYDYMCSVFFFLTPSLKKSDKDNQSCKPSNISEQLPALISGHGSCIEFLLSAHIWQEKKNSLCKWPSHVVHQ